MDIKWGCQERLFFEFYNSNWWGRAQQHIPSKNKFGNIPTDLRNKAEAKVLVGIIPTLQGTKDEHQTSQFRQLIRSVFHKCINILIEPLHSQYHSGVLLKVNSYNIRCNIILASIIGNWPENCKSCLTYSGTSCARPCHTCLVGKNELNAIDLPTNHKSLQWDKAKITHYMKKPIVFGIICKASEYKHMMKVMPFVLEGLFEGKKNELLVQMFVNWNKMYCYSRQYKFTQTDLCQFESLVESYKRNEESISEILEGLHHFIPVLNDYFKLLPPMSKTQMEKTEANLILYESFTLTNNEQVRATKNYYNAPMFSDVAVFMNLEQKEFKTYDGYCFA
ncbi:16835_t:CDS:2, partial [Cetraspora pellucida]